MPEKPKYLEETIEGLGNAEQFNLNNLAIGGKVEVKTKNTAYLIERGEDGLYISGSEKYCPKPTKVYIEGSTYGGRAIINDTVVVGGYLEFTLPDRQGPITTSQIEEFNSVE
jgi:hypothetical protein